MKKKLGPNLSTHVSVRIVDVDLRILKFSIIAPSVFHLL